MIHLVADENWAITMAEHRKGTASTYLFFAGASMLTKLALAGVLVFFAYVFEYIHSSKGP